MDLVRWLRLKLERGNVMWRSCCCQPPQNHVLRLFEFRPKLSKLWNGAVTSSVSGE